MSLYAGLCYSKLTPQELPQIRQENEKFYLKLAVFVLLSLSRLLFPPVINVDETINDSQITISEKIGVQTDPFGQSNIENETWVQKFLARSGGDLTPTPAPPSNFGIENSWKPTLSQNNINRNSGPGARARADAMRDFRNGQQKKSTTKAGVADAFKPTTTYSHYNHYKRATSALQAKNIKPNKWLDQLPIDSPSRYREGPSPFADYQYNPQHNGQNLDFSNQKAENHMFDRDAKKA
jgi:hypothetical protein